MEEAKLVGIEHADIKYLKQDHISPVLSEALHATFLRKPNDPIQFFCRHLQNHVYKQKMFAQARQDSQDQAAMQEEHQRNLNKSEAANKEEEAEAKKVEAKKKYFRKDLEKSDDMNDKLQNLCDYLKEHTKATGCYIGYLQYPEVPIEDDALENDHLNMEAPKVVKFTHADDDHKYLVGRCIEESQGITHDVFAEQADDKESDGGKPAEGEEGEEEGRKVEEDLLVSFKHVYVKEVVRERRIHFQRVPRLGSYLAVPLIYKHCLSDTALDAAIEDFKTVREFNENVLKEKTTYLEEYENRKKTALDNNEYWEEEIREFPIEEIKQFHHTEEKFVVCLDTLGQDREFSDDERRLVLRTIADFRSTWEKEQEYNLTKDRDEVIEYTKDEAAAEEGAEAAVEKDDPMVEMERQVEESLVHQAIDGQDPVHVETMGKQMRLNKIGELFLENETMVAELEKLKRMKVLKLPKILQSLMYLLGFDREKVCQKNSQNFFWKSAKKDFARTVPKAMKTYKVLGQNRNEIKLYQKINYCEKLITGMEEEAVTAINPTMGKLFKWLSLAITSRKQDIIHRKAEERKGIMHREKCIEQDEERKALKAKFTEEAEDVFNRDHAADFEAFENQAAEKKKKEQDEYGSEDEGEDSNKEPVDDLIKPEFNAIEAQAKFDEDNPEIEIPEEVTIQVDNDWVLTPEEMQAHIDQYLVDK